LVIECIVLVENYEIRMPNIPPTLFDKYGGIPGVRELVRQFHERFITKPTLRRYFDGVDSQKLIQHHVEMIAYAMGRPAASFDPKQMSAQHHPRGITLSAFEQIINMLRQVLLEANVEGRDIAEIIHRMDLQRHRIVRDAPPVSNIYHPEHIDPLTGLGNREALHEVLDAECLKYRDTQRDLSLALMLPAGAGRDVLPHDSYALQLIERHLAGVLARTVREADALVRCEDGKFGLVLRATDAAKAMLAAKRIQSVVIRERFMISGDKIDVQLMIGIASLGGHTTTRNQLIDAAENAVRRASLGTQKIIAAD
jgi:hemoglobin